MSHLRGPELLSQHCCEALRCVGGKTVGECLRKAQTSEQRSHGCGIVQAVDEDIVHMWGDGACQALGVHGQHGPDKGPGGQPGDAQTAKRIEPRLDGRGSRLYRGPNGVIVRGYGKADADRTGQKAASGQQVEVPQDQGRPG